MQQAPPDPILGLTVAFKEDKDPRKCNLGVGAYRDNDGKPYVFPIVRKIEAELAKDTTIDKEYLPIDGLAEFCKGARMAVFGWDSPHVDSDRIGTIQTLSGTGALRVIADTLAAFKPGAIYVSNPTWSNHHGVFAAAGLKIREYRYFDKKTKGLDLAGCLADLEAAAPGSVVMLHTCAHNPTGVDPTEEEWKKIAEVCKRNQLYPFFDTAYQGFSSGSMDKDAFGLRHFLNEGFEMCISQSFAKVMGLYGERIGACHFVCADKATKERLMSQVRIIVRVQYSSPPKHGALVAAKILTNPEYRNAWLAELAPVCNRMNEMRAALKAALVKNGCPGDWSHITTQIGMFSFTGLTVAQSDRMVNHHHIYMTKNGRISICGVTTKNVDYIADAIKEVVTHKY